MEELTKTIADLPWAGLIPVALMLFVGIVLWSAGRRVLRTAFAAAGLVLGAALGWAASDLSAVSSLAIPAWVMTVVAALLVAMFAALLYRVVLAGAIAVLLGTLAPLSVWTAVEVGVIPVSTNEAIAQTPMPMGPLANGSDTPLTDLDRWIETVLEPGPEPPAPEGDDAGAAIDSATGDVATISVQSWGRRIADVAVDLPRSVWNDSPEPLKWSLLASAAVGGLLGLVLGAGAPSFSAAVVTALGGSVIMLASGWTLGTRLEMPHWAWLPGTTTLWLIWWLGLSIIGLCVQWTLRARRADKPAS